VTAKKHDFKNDPQQRCLQKAGEDSISQGKFNGVCHLGTRTLRAEKMLMSPMGKWRFFCPIDKLRRRIASTVARLS
jgi:hypothetical protein